MAEGSHPGYPHGATTTVWSWGHPSLGEDGTQRLPGGPPRRIRSRLAHSGGISASWPGRVARGFPGAEQTRQKDRPTRKGGSSRGEQGCGGRCMAGTDLGEERGAWLEKLSPCQTRLQCWPLTRKQTHPQRRPAMVPGQKGPLGPQHRCPLHLSSSSQP